MAHLRRLAEDPDYQPIDAFGRVAASQLVVVAVIVLLVTVKPG